jgi:hypothetical protein
MAKWGRSPFPRRFGGGRHPAHDEFDALRESLSPFYDVSADGTVYDEAWAQACQIAHAWLVAERAKGVLVPARMLEVLTDWEEACRTRPSGVDSAHDRRARVAAKLRGLIGNTVGDISAALTELLGSRFVQLQFADPADEIVYWPGINPGPPGLEWSSNRAVMAVVMNDDGLSADDFTALRNRASEFMDSIIPAWMTYRIGQGEAGDGFIVDVGVVDVTFL